MNTMFWFPRRPPRAIRQIADKLYAAVVAQARIPALYLQPLNIPDSFDGRFDSVVLHNLLLIYRLQNAAGGRMLNQALFDRMFKDFEHNNRQVGVGDMSIRRHFNRMTAAFNGRRTQYFSLLDQKDAYGLALAFSHNVYREDTDLPPPSATALAEYAIAQQEGLFSQPDSVIMTGEILWQRADRSNGNISGKPTIPQDSATAA